MTAGGLLYVNRVLFKRSPPFCLSLVPVKFMVLSLQDQQEFSPQYTRYSSSVTIESNLDFGRDKLPV